MTSPYHGSKIMTTIGGLCNGDGEEQKNVFARASRFCVHFLALVYDRDMKLPNFTRPL